MNDFDTAFDRLLGNEGGYSNDLHDPGGETNWGISKRSYPHVDIKGLTRDGAKGIYKNDFWAPLQELPFPLKYQLFDFAVNSGIQTAVRKLQVVVGVADDGHWGPISAAAMAKQDVATMTVLLVAQRLQFMAKLSGWPTFGAGWANRIAKQLAYAAEDLK